GLRGELLMLAEHLADVGDLAVSVKSVHTELNPGEAEDFFEHVDSDGLIQHQRLPERLRQGIGDGKIALDKPVLGIVLLPHKVPLVPRARVAVIELFNVPYIAYHADLLPPNWRSQCLEEAS